MAKPILAPIEGGQSKPYKTKKLVVDGREIVMDEDVYEFLKDKRVEWTGGGYPMVRLHTMFFPRDGRMIDHINRNKADCRRVNLRPATYALNNRNKTKPKHGVTSQFKGVCRDRFGNFRANIHVCGKQVFLGVHRDEERAAKIHDIAVLFFFPDILPHNFPPETYAEVDAEAELREIIKHKPINNTSGYRGVFRSRNGQKWYARYGRLSDGKPRHLGTFDTAEEAARARDDFARANGIRLCRLNFMTFEEWLANIGWDRGR